MDILIGGAWPYANGSLHIGHVACLLPGDVIARYHRAKGNRVYYVSGSDCHGTPVSIRAGQEGKKPEEISGFYHKEFQAVFEQLGFSYDLYGATTWESHKNFVIDFHRKMYEGPYIYEKEAPQAYCDICRQYLTDRMVEGECPQCGASARGDQCDACTAVLEPEQLQNPRCGGCGGTPVFQQKKHLYLAVSTMEEALRDQIDRHPAWRKNARAFTLRYIEEGLRDRAITRALDLGIDVPKAGYEDSKIYIWAENVLGYPSMSAEVAIGRGWDFEALWQGGDAKHYYVHGKDNIPFHTIILPALLIAHGGGWRLPDEIVSSEYMTLEGQKISTSRNWAVWAKDLIGHYDPDSLRYYFIANNPEKRDADFSWQEYVTCHNSELLGAFGNLVNRTLKFVEKYGDGIVPEGTLDKDVAKKITDVFKEVDALLDQGACKSGLLAAMAFVREMNKYFDAQMPWKTRETDPSACNQCIYNCLAAIGALSMVMEPFLPFASAKIRAWLKIEGEPRWQAPDIQQGKAIDGGEPLFERLDKGVAEMELERLKENLGK